MSEFGDKKTGCPGSRDSNEGGPDWLDLYGDVEAGNSEDADCMLGQVESNTERGRCGVR